MTTSSADAFNTFITDPGRREIVLAEFYPYNIAQEATEALRTSSAKYATKPTDVGAHVPYKAQLLSAIDFYAETHLPGVTGVIDRPASGQIRIGVHFGNLDQWADPTKYSWLGRDVIVRVGGYSPKLRRSLDLDEFEVKTYQSESAVLDADGRELIVNLRDQNSQFDDDLQDRTFLDTGWTLKTDGTAADFIGFGDVTKLKIVDELSMQGRFFHKQTGALQMLAGWTSGANYPFRLTISADDHLELRWTKGGSLVTKTMAATLVDATPYVFDVRLVDTEVVLKVAPEETRVAVREAFAGTGFTGRDAPSGGSAYRMSFTASVLWDMCRVWAQAKSEQSLINSRYRPLTTSEKASSLLRHSLPFDDATGTVVTDESSSPANGTVNGDHDWYPSLLGSAEAAGGVLPDCFGEGDGANPPLVDPSTFIFMAHSSSMDAIKQTYEGALGHLQGNSYTDVFAFLASTTGAAKSDTLITPWGSYFRLGSRPTRRVTFDFRGDSSGAGYVYTAADVVRRAMTARGSIRIADPAGLDTASFAQLNTDNSAVINYFTREKVTRREFIDKVLDAVGAVTYRKRHNGLQSVYRFNGVVGVPVLRLDSTNILSIKEDHPARPSWRQKLGYARCWSVMDFSELSPVASGHIAAFYQQEHRYALSDGDTRAVHLLAESVKKDTLLRSAADAGDEADRLQGILGTMRKPLIIEINSQGFPLDRFQVVTVQYSDFDQNNKMNERFNLASGQDAIIIGCGEHHYTDLRDGYKAISEVAVWL